MNPSSCPTTRSAAVFRIYKKTSAAVCERPRGPELWTISSIVSAPRSPTVWHWNNRCPNVSFLTQRGDVGVGPEPLLGLLIFNYMICFILLRFNSRLRFERGPPEGEQKLPKSGDLEVYVRAGCGNNLWNRYLKELLMVLVYKLYTIPNIKAVMSSFIWWICFQIVAVIIT